MRDWLGAGLAGLLVYAVAMAPSCVRALPPPPPPLSSGVAPCPAPEPEPVAEDVCEGSHTPEDLVCIRCDVDRGCLLADVAVYCTPACSDPYCAAPGRHR